MAIYPIACKEMAIRRKKLYHWILSFGIGNGQLISIMTSFEREFYGEYVIYKKIFCSTNSLYNMAVLTEACIESQFSGVCIYCL